LLPPRQAPLRQANITDLPVPSSPVSVPIIFDLSRFSHGLSPPTAATSLTTRYRIVAATAMSQECRAFRQPPASRHLRHAAENIGMVGYRLCC